MTSIISRSAARRLHRASPGAVAVALAVLWFSALVLAQGRSAEYTVGPKDVLSVTVLNEPSLSGRFTVLEDGTVAYPLLGPLQVGGLPAAAVQRELVKRLADGYIERPVVSVAVEEFGSRRFFVLGEVRQPGAYPLAGSTTVLEALLTAGGPTATAGTQVHIVRAGTTASDAAQSPAATMDLAALQRGDLAHNVALRDGDLLYLPPVEAPIPVYVMGLVNAPGAYQLRRGTTVLQALAQAGGVSDRGSTSRVKVVRKVDGRTLELKAALDDVVEPGDTLVVRRRYF